MSEDDSKLYVRYWCARRLIRFHVTGPRGRWCADVKATTKSRVLYEKGNFKYLTDYQLLRTMTEQTGVKVML